MSKLQDLISLFTGSRVVDLAPVIENGMPRWPTHPPLIVNPTVTHENDGYFCQTLFMPEHIGAHVDAPAHIHSDRMHLTIDTIEVSTLLAPATVFHLSHLNLEPGDLVNAETLQEINASHSEKIAEGDIALLDYGWMKYYRVGPGWREYSENAPGLTEDAVRWLANQGVRAVGSDTIACDQAIKNGEVVQESFGHDDYWLPRGILIMEGLVNLDKLPDRCFFIATPLKIKGGSGSPLRPIALFFD